jgi:aspartate racemase
MHQKVIGIVGGMGPEAGIALHKSILANTNARTDQEHLSIITMSFPGLISDRTAYLEGKSSINPAYEIARVIDKLSLVGAEVIGIACNTCHVPKIFEIVMDEVSKIPRSIELLNMPYEVGDYLKKRISDGSRVGILMTNGTYNSRLYEKVVQKAGCVAVIPDLKFQNDVVHKMIYDPKIGIKANCGCITREAQFLFEKTIDLFIAKGCDVVTLGCTELSLTVDLQSNYTIEFVDSTQCLATALVNASTNYQLADLQDGSLLAG